MEMNTNENFAAGSQAGGQPAAAETASAPTATAAQRPTKFCTHCGGKIDARAVVCPLCGCQVEKMVTADTPNIVISNTNTNMNAAMLKSPKDKWLALLLCFFLGCLGVHKFYEGKVVMGILYLFTVGLFGIGVFIDFIILLFKPNPYYV